MPPLTPRRSMMTALIVLLLSAGALFAVDRFGTGSRTAGRSGALAEPGGVRRTVEDPTEAYRLWKQMGYRGRHLVFVADRWESFDPGELIPERMYRAYPLQLYNTARLLEEQSLNGVTFLYVASMNGIVRKISAVVPEAELARMREQVPRVKDSRAEAAGVFLSRQGFPRWYTTGERFRADREPALVYVGASYFRSVQPEELLRQLTRAGLRTDCLVLCRETGREGVAAAQRERLERFARLVGAVPAP